MERLQPLSKQVIRNDKTVNQEAFYNFTQLFLEYLESLNSPPPYQCNRSNKSVVVKYISFLFQVINRHPQTAISVSPHLLQICNLLMNPLNDNQIREDTWRYLINCINCYDILAIFKSYLQNAFDPINQEFRIDIGEVGKINEDSFLKQFDQILIKMKKSQDTEKFKLNLQLATDALPIKVLKKFSLQFRNKVIIQLISEIGLFEKKFKFTFFDTSVDPKLFIYISEIFSVIPPDQSNMQIIYRFIKRTFPYIIQNDAKENLTKRANMFYFIKNSKYRESIALSYFQAIPDDAVELAYKHLYDSIQTSFHNVFVKIIDRSIQIFPILLKNMKESTEPYVRMYNMCKFFTHALRLKGITKSLLQYENEKSIIGYFLSISIYNLPFDMLPFMTIFLLTFFIDRKTINISEETHFVENLLSIVPPNYIAQIIQVFSKFSSQFSVGFSPAIFNIKDEKLRSQILNNPVIFERENVYNQTLHEIIKKNSFVINTISTTTDSSIVTTTNVVTTDPNFKPNTNKIIRSNSSDGFFTILKSIHFFFNIDCYSFTSSEAFEFIFNYIQCFDGFTNNTLISTITDAFASLIKLFSNFNRKNFDFSLITDKFLPFAFKSFFDQKSNLERKELFFCSLERFIRVFRENFLLTHQISKFWCVSILSILPKNNSIVLRAAIQACLEGLPYSFSLVHAIFISISDIKFRDTQIIAFLTCISIISPEFRNYSLQELELYASSSDKVDNIMVCMSILLLLHNLYDNKDNENELNSKIDKEVRVLFLHSLGKMRSSPSLVTSLLLLLPSFFEQLDSRFELIFDTILMDVNELMIKLMETKNQSQNIHPSTSNFAASDPSSAVYSNQPDKAFHSISPSSLTPSLPRNHSAFVISMAPISTFVSPSFLNTEKQADSDPISNLNLKIQNEEMIPANPSNGSIRQIVENRDYTTIQVFKSITFFCVKLFLSAKKRLQIRKRIVELFQSWTNFNNRRTESEFYEKFKEILSRSVGLCFSPPRPNFDRKKKLVFFGQNENVLLSKKTSSSVVVNTCENEFFYKMKISLDYSSSVYSVRPIRNSPFVKSKSPSVGNNRSRTICGSKNQARPRLNHFSFRNRAKAIEQQKMSASDQINVNVRMPGLSLFFDALEEANECEIETDDAASMADFIGNFESKFKKQFFIRLIYFNQSKNSKKVSDKNDQPKNQTNQEENTTKNQNNQNINTAKNQTTNQNSQNINTTKNQTTNQNSQNINTTKNQIISQNGSSEIVAKDQTINQSNANTLKNQANKSNNLKDTNSEINRKTNLNHNNNTQPSKNENNTTPDDQTFDTNSNDNDDYDSLISDNSIPYSPQFAKFLSSLGQKDENGNIVSSTTLYDAVFEMHPSERHIVAVVWVEDPTMIESVIRLLSKEKRHLVIITICCSKSGIVHTKVVYSSLLISAKKVEPGCEKDFFYFDTFHGYSYPNCENNGGIVFAGFGPLVGSLFLPCTLVAKLVTETAVNAILFRKTQMKNMDQYLLNKKKKRKLFPHRP